MKTEEDNIKVENTKTEDNRIAQIEKWNGELKDLDEKIKTVETANKAKLEHNEHIAALRKQRDEARIRLAEIQSTSGEKWEEIKSDLDNLWSEIRNRFDKIKSIF